MAGVAVVAVVVVVFNTFILFAIYFNMSGRIMNFFVLQGVVYVYRNASEWQSTNGMFKMSSVYYSRCPFFSLHSRNDATILYFT